MWCGLGRKITTRWKLCSEAIGRRSWRKWVILWRAGVDLEKRSVLQGILSEGSRRKYVTLRTGKIRDCVGWALGAFWSSLCCPGATSMLAELVGSQDRNRAGFCGTTLAGFYMKTNACRLSAVLFYIWLMYNSQNQMKSRFCSCRSCKGTKEQKIWTTKKKSLKRASWIDRRQSKTCLTRC